MDQLTEEAEADLANNNDPNNNASIEGDPVTNFFPQSGEPSHLTDNGNNPNLNHFDHDHQYDDDENEEDMDPIEEGLQRDAHLVLKLMPDRNFDEVRFMLESHQDNPSRVQVSKLRQ